MAARVVPSLLLLFAVRHTTNRICLRNLQSLLFRLKIDVGRWERDEKGRTFWELTVPFLF